MGDMGFHGIAVLSFFFKRYFGIFDFNVQYCVSPSPAVWGFASFWLTVFGKRSAFKVLRYHLFALSGLIQINTMCTLGARDFSSAVSGFCRLPFSTRNWFVTRASVSFRRFSEKPANRSFQPICIRLCIRLYNISSFKWHIYIYVQIYKLYLSPCKLYIRNFQPIYKTVQHLLSDTTYILVFNTFVTLAVP